MQNYFRKSLILILFTFILLCLPASSFAADISFISDKNTFAPNEDFLVQVFLDTQDVTVNATEGTVIFPSNLLELKEVRDGNSAINFWVEKPHIVADGKISFSGITAGGFSGPKIFLFGLLFHSKQLGSNAIAFDGVQVLQNDGLGTKIPTTANPFSFSITKEGSTAPKDLKVGDIDPPEDFTPFIARDPSIFNGKYFLVFSTVDKGVGIDHYEVREGIWSDYVLAESPYLLSDQSLGKEIIVKAVDKAGNKTLAEVPAQNPNFSLEVLWIIVIILLICLSALISHRKKIWPKSTPK